MFAERSTLVEECYRLADEARRLANMHTVTPDDRTAVVVASAFLPARRLAQQRSAPGMTDVSKWHGLRSAECELFRRLSH
jgi:hypothetical protein